jgi:hypothetical protein
MAKIKTMNYKEFALEHGEKIGLGVIGVIALACLGMTTWSSDLTVTPDEMEKQASKVDSELKVKQWPDSEKANFLPLKTADEEYAVATRPVNPLEYEWEVEMSPKLYKRSRPAGEIDWLPPVELYARFGTMPMGVMPPPAPLAAAADEPAEKKKPAKKPGRKQGNSADELLASDPASGMGIGMDGAGFGATSGEKARGERFNVVVGVVNVVEQHKRIYKAMSLDSLPQAAQYLEYLDFKIQRQRAVPGPDPWNGPWKDLSTESSMDRIAESSDQDPEIVAQKYTEQVITSPLPHRLDVDWWDPNEAGHPKIPTLTEDQIEQQDLENRAAAEVVGEDAEAEKTKRKGFARNQRDANKVRDQAMGMNDGQSMQDAMKKYGGGAAGPSRGSSAGSRGMTAPGMNMPPMGGDMAGMPRGSSGMAGSMAAGMMGPGLRRGMTSGGMMSGSMIGQGEAHAPYLLFRYFDFEVEPGECYRYRVQFEVINPNFGETFVDSPNVAEGETRTTPWSVPSTPAVVEKDVNYALARASTKGTRPDGAELKVVQFDPNSGTLLSDAFKVPFGAFVSKAMKSLHLDLPAQKLEEGDVEFRSRDVLLDSIGAPNLSAAAIAELKLDSKQSSALKRGGELDLAVTVDRFGDILGLDASSKQDIGPALKKVKEERSEFEAARAQEKADKKAKEKEDNETGKKGKGRRRKKGDGPNPMRSSMSSMTAGMPGMGGPSGPPSNSKSSRPSNSRAGSKGGQ